MKAFSRFTPSDLTPKPSNLQKLQVAQDWYQAELDEKFRLSLSQTRTELRSAMRYKAAWEFLVEEVKSIAGGNEMPLVKEKRLAACLKIVKKNWSDLA